MLSFLEGGGLAAEAIHKHDWSRTPLGPLESWPSVLKTTVSLILTSRFPQCIVWGPSLVTIPNDAFLPILGNKPVALGRPFSDVWSEVWSSLEPITAKAFAGESTYIEDYPLTIERNGYPESATFTFCYSPIRDKHGRVLGMLDTVTETTEKVALHERQRLLSGELGHRLKNLLTVVQAVASQTLRRAPDLVEADKLLAFRLAAIGRASDVLTASEWTDADLHDLVRTALATHGNIADRFEITGPQVRFSAQVALAMTLALHELATNATKYGALSNETGRIRLNWAIDDGPNPAEPRFSFTWRELDGPPVQPPAHRGFGSLMIERSLRSYFRGETKMSFEPTGLTFRIDAPLAGAQADDSA